MSLSLRIKVKLIYYLPSNIMQFESKNRTEFPGCPIYHPTIIYSTLKAGVFNYIENTQNYDLITPPPPTPYSSVRKNFLGVTGHHLEFFAWHFIECNNMSGESGKFRVYCHSKVIKWYFSVRIYQHMHTTNPSVHCWTSAEQFWSIAGTNFYLPRDTQHDMNHHDAHDRSPRLLSRSSRCPASSGLVGLAVKTFEKVYM